MPAEHGTERRLSRGAGSRDEEAAQMARPAQVARPASSADTVVLLFDEPPATQAEQAYRILLEDIVTLKLDPGDVLAEDALRERLGLGRTPIREALQRLASEDLVVVLPRRGVIVSQINVTDLTEIYEVRSRLEGLAARLAAERFGDGELPPGVAADLTLIPETTGFLALIAVDRRLHRVVHHLARNRYLLDNLDWYLNLSIRLVLAAARRLPAPPVAEMAETMADFHDLFVAIVAHDGDRAEEIASRHSGFSEGMLRRTV
jgi:DNA-binding GntR family transcriptional regulator